ncbi:MAG: efflux RND transporter periplasmic adaptor subunit [Rhizobiales bacterium]|uniref:efflux RND transporter periplasmic adaptor subunit n=1 Tax=Azorhizobium caulinodans TaxID=7 RepID=UPI001AD58DAC|nr:efflux RND transporter periplasmic adaptor subunit [Hyphomicrobiales bacterium]
MNPRLKAVPAMMALVLALAACGQGEAQKSAGTAEAPAAASAEYERGPHGGRLLRSGDLALELTIFEEGQEPEFHLYPFQGDRPLDPALVKARITLSRLGGRVDTIDFKPDGEFLRGDGAVKEPHSFDVAIRADYEGKTHDWSFSSYEGRTTIEAAAAETGGVKAEPAGAAVIQEVVDLSGRVMLHPQARAEVRAWYPGRIVEMTKSIGQPVRQGDVLVRIEASDTLRTYPITAPISGVITERNANVGDVATQAIYVIADTSRLQAAFFAFPRDAELLRPGQAVEIKGLAGQTARSTIQMLLPSTDLATQTTSIFAELPNPEGVWRPGMIVEGIVTVAADKVPLAVRTRALQRFRDFTVVYAKVGDTYEVRMLKLGRRTPEWVEVLGGIDPGEVYVSDNAFLIRADVEKSGASHDH